MAPKSQIPRPRYGSPRNAAHHVFCESAKRNFGYSCKRATVHLTGLTDGGRKPEKSHSSGKPCGSVSFPNLDIEPTRDLLRIKSARAQFCPVIIRLREPIDRFRADATLA